MKRVLLIFAIALSTILQPFVGGASPRSEAAVHSADISIESQMLIQNLEKEEGDTCCKDEAAEKAQGSSCKVDCKILTTAYFLPERLVREGFAVLGGTVVILRHSILLLRPPIA